ncbi:MAG: ATP-binding protein [Acidimicrobiia bacterium]
MTASAPRFPFSAVVGQDDARLALLLAAIDPAIGGVLLRGEKGTAKSTMARSLAGLLPGGAPFVELPLGTTEERLVGTLDPRSEGGEVVFLPGLLEAAHGGVLYVDEVNLLPAPLVDALLDVAASGVNRIERPGLSHEHPARFVLVGSMNPEEGELRPQLLDRFGLAVEVLAPDDPVTRAEIVRRRLTHDAGGQVVGTESDIVLRARLAAAMPAELPDDIVTFACRLAVSVGAQGLRADLVLCRAAAALAGWSGRGATTEADIEQVASLALGHRRQRKPFAPPIIADDELQRALAAVRRSFGRDAEPAAPAAPAPAASAARERSVAVPGLGGEPPGARQGAPAAPAGTAEAPNGPVVGDGEDTGDDGGDTASGAVRDRGDRPLPDDVPAGDGASTATDTLAGGTPVDDGDGEEAAHEARGGDDRGDDTAGGGPTPETGKALGDQ